jgi:hypothetical protein
MALAFVNLTKSVLIYVGALFHTKSVLGALFHARHNESGKLLNIVVTP